jgi:tetratricopeptide (TPR) repeat protein
MDITNFNKKVALIAIGMILIGAVVGVQSSYGQTVDERLKRVVDEVVKGQYDAAINDMNEVLKVDPNNGLAFKYRGLSHVGKREFTEGIADYNRAISINPGAASFYWNRAFAVQLLPNPDHKAAYDDLTQAIKLNPKEKSYYRDRAYPSIKKQDWDQAESDLSTAIALGENSAEVYINRGMVFINLQYYSLAIGDSREALARDPGNEVARRNLDLAISLRKQTPAQKAIEKLMAEGVPESSLPNLLPETAQKLSRAAELIKAEDHKQVAAILDELAVREPNNPRVLYLQAIDFFNQGFFNPASVHATLAINRDSKNAKFYFLRGIVRLYAPYAWRYDQIQDGLKDLDKAVELDPAYGPAYSQKAQALFHFSPDNTYAAMNTAEEAVNIDPKDGESYFIIGLADIFRTKYKEAVTALDQAVNAGVNTSEVYENRGYVNFETKNRAQAIADYQKSLALNPDNPIAKKNLELLLAKSKYTLFPPAPTAANKWVVEMQELFKQYKDEVGKANYWAHVGGDSQEEICRNLSGWNTSIHNSMNYAASLSSRSRDPDDKTFFAKLFAEGMALEKKSKAQLDAQKCVF